MVYSVGDILYVDGESYCVVGKITYRNTYDSSCWDEYRMMKLDGGKVVICSHLGKPKNGPEAKFSLAPAAARLAELLPGTKVTFAADDEVVGANAKAAVAAMADGDIVVLENTRFRGNDETKNGENISKELADLVDGQVFVMDAFGSSH